MLENRKRLYRSVERMIAYFFYSRVARNRVLPNRAQKGKDFSRTKKDPCSSYAETTHKELARAQPLSVFHLASSLNFFPSLSLSLLFIIHARVLLRALACCQVKRGVKRRKETKKEKRRRNKVRKKRDREEDKDFSAGE